MPQLEQVEFFISQLFWLGVFFVILFLVLTYFTLPKIRAFLNKRDEFVQSHISKQDELIKKAEQLIENYEQKLNEACLLYTSPSPRDVEESRMPSSA